MNGKLTPLQENIKRLLLKMTPNNNERTGKIWALGMGE